MNAPADYSFPAAMRLRSRDDFRRTFDRRCVVSDGVLRLHCCENGLPHPRLGLSVSRKVGNAVERNRWKRLLREAFRLGRHDLPTGVDMIVVPRPEVTPQLVEVSQSLVSLAKQAIVKLARRRP